MPGRLEMEELRRLVADGEIDTVLVALPDMQGRLMGKRFQAQHFVEHAWQETHSCNYLLATDMEMEPVDGYKSTSWAAGYGDYTMCPDMSTCRRIPWLDGTALVLCDVLDHHTRAEIPHAPRAVLKKQIERLKAANLKPLMATELEFFLFRESYDEISRGARPTTVSEYNEDYHIFQTSKEEDVMRAVRNGLYGADIPVENSKGEASAGQEEINVTYADALTMADRHVILKNGIKEIAFARGRSVTFMAKWHYDYAGNSCHIHQSLVSIQDGQPVFCEPANEHGMSPLMTQYLAGLLRHASEITYFLAPYVNSYKRYMAGTFAPTKAVWSVDNRTAGYRICGADSKSVRIECRVGGADLNPYLAMAALLAAGMAGIEQGMHLEAEFAGNAYGGEGREIPKSLRTAAAALNDSTMLRAAFGDDVVDHYVHCADWEQFESDRRVTDWDFRRGFERA
ncbi:MAG: glutamine synthetase family protein [Hyphomicrobiaceae bacterium]